MSVKAGGLPQPTSCASPLCMFAKVIVELVEVFPVGSESFRLQMKWSRLLMSLAVCYQSFHQPVSADTSIAEATAAQQWCHQVQHGELAGVRLLNEQVFSFTTSPTMSEQARKTRPTVTSLFLLQPSVPLFTLLILFNLNCISVALFTSQQQQWWWGWLYSGSLIASSTRSVLVSKTQVYW